MDPRKTHNNLLNDVQQFFDKEVQEFGATHEAVDYNSKESQELRFLQLLKIIDTEESFSIIDYGCGYGEMVHYMQNLGLKFEYQGFDISEAMIKQATEYTPETSEWNFTTNLSEKSNQRIIQLPGQFLI